MKVADKQFTKKSQRQLHDNAKVKRILNTKHPH